MGAAPCGASISQWFSNRERGTRYGIWSTTHSLGEAATFFVTAAIIAWWGWQWGFWSAGGVSIVVAILLFFTLGDRPQTYGLPAIADYRNDHTEESAGPPISVRQAQWEVIANPYIWILGFSCAAMYVARYGINNWGMLYLQEDKGYTLVTAGAVLSTAKIVETFGALSSGFISDRLFKARRNVATLLYGLIEITGLVILFWGPSTFLCTLDLPNAQYLTNGTLDNAVRNTLESSGLSIPPDMRVFADDGGKDWQIGYDTWYLRWKGYRIEASDTTLIVRWKYHPLHLLGMSMFGFGLGGLLVFLGGLIAIDISSKRASGAAMGLVGMFSYLGASLQDLMSGHLLEAGKMVVNGQDVHNFTPAVHVWLGAAIFAVLLSCTLWNVKAKD
jgi:sugar phosphate permease